MTLASRILAGSPRDTSEEKERGILAALAEKVELEGRKNFFQLRSKWSSAIMGWIFILIIFNIGLTISVGVGWLDFDDNRWFLTTVTVETFLQVVGLGYIAVRYLFSDGVSLLK